MFPLNSWITLFIEKLSVKKSKYMEIASLSLYQGIFLNIELSEWTGYLLMQ